MKCNKNPEKIEKMFDEISIYYDGMNNLISLGTHYILKIIAIKTLEITQNANVLDLCCGTGDFTKIITKTNPNAKVIGLDFSKEMIKLAIQKNPHKTFICGDCTNLPFGDNEFDFITMGFGLRNIENRTKAIQEAFRVLKSGGKFLQLDFGYHNKISSIFDFIVPFIAKIMNKNSEHYNYLLKSKNEFPEPEKLIKEFENCGFELVKKQEFLFGSIAFQIVKKP